MRAGHADNPAPFHASGGGDLLPAVQAVSAVVVAVLEVQGDELQAVGAAMHLLGVVRVHGVNKATSTFSPSRPASTASSRCRRCMVGYW